MVCGWFWINLALKQGVAQSGCFGGSDWASDGVHLGEALGLGWACQLYLPYRVNTTCAVTLLAFSRFLYFYFIPLCF